MLAAAVIAAVRPLLFRKPVLELRGREVVIRGVQTGFWKLFQVPRTETITYDEIVRVRAGCLRNRFFRLSVSSGTSKPATCGHFKTSQSEAGDSYQFSGLIQGLVAGSEINEPEPRSEP
jgi:hypothetical protein